MPISRGAPKELDMLNGHELGELIDGWWYGRFAEIIDWNHGGGPKICQARVKFDKDGAYISHHFTDWEDATDVIVVHNQESE